MADDSDPPRKFYDFKPKEFENVNQVPPPPDPGAPVAPAPPPPVDDGRRIEVKHLLQQAQMGGPLLAPQGRPAGPKNEVHAILDENLARANAAGLNDLAPMQERVSRRRRHYLVLTILGTAFLGTLVVVNGRTYYAANGADPVAALRFGASIAALVFFNLMLWWIMFHIMDDY